MIFVDVLGFARLVEDHPLDVEKLKILDAPIGENVWAQIEASKDPLAATFTRFHNAVSWAPKLAIDHSLTSITFSDSAFLATQYLHHAVDTASHLMLTLMSQRVPVRIGIGFGTFAAMRFHSDVGTTSGRAVSAAHFLGTSVVRSHAAEHCGLKGMRILLHPSVHQLLEDSKHNPLVETGRRVLWIDCPEDAAENKPRVSREINYWWKQGVTDERKAWHAFQDMWAAIPGSAGADVRYQYHSTAIAINRMRVQLGEPALSELRRRTLPRRQRTYPQLRASFGGGLL